MSNCGLNLARLLSQRVPLIPHIAIVSARMLALMGLIIQLYTSCTIECEEGES